MKKILFLFLISLSLKAQLIEISGGFGYYTNEPFSSFIKNFEVISVNSIKDTYKLDNFTQNGILFANVRILGEKASFGVFAGLDKYQGEILRNDNQITTKANFQALTVGGELTIDYLDVKFAKLYFLGGAGYTFNSTDFNNSDVIYTVEKQNQFNYQISPIGAKIGNRIGVFAELGWGYKGVINAGLFLKI